MLRHLPFLLGALGEDVVVQSNETVDRLDYDVDRTDHCVADLQPTFVGGGIHVREPERGLWNLGTRP